MSAALLKLSTMLGCMSLIGKGSLAVDIASMGISPEDWKLFTGERGWIATDRMRITNIVDVLLHGVVDMIGVPRFELPAEYIAAVLFTFVHPCNLSLSCRWLERKEVLQQTDILTGVIDTDVEAVSASHLFALICEAADNTNPEQFKLKFEKRAGLLLEQRLAKDEKSK